MLGNFNRAFKLDRSAFEAWMQVFNRVDDAVMLMFEWKDEPATIGNIRRAAGPHRQRIFFAKLPPVNQRFASKGLANLFLDTPLYNAHGTATEVLSAGVPVVTHAGTDRPSRASSAPCPPAATLCVSHPRLLLRQWRSCQPRCSQRASCSGNTADHRPHNGGLHRHRVPPCATRGIEGPADTDAAFAHALVFLSGQRCCLGCKSFGGHEVGFSSLAVHLHALRWCVCFDDDCDLLQQSKCMYAYARARVFWAQSLTLDAGCFGRFTL